VTAEQAIRAISRLATLYDEPFSDIAQIPTFLVSELAKRHVKVCLSGDGADCLFGGVELYATASQILRETGWIPYIARLLAAHTLKRVPPYFAYPILRVGCYLKKDAWKNIDPAHIQQRMAAVLPYKSREALYLELTSHCKRPDEIVLEAKEPKTVFTDPSQWVGLRDYEHHMMYIGQRSWIPDGTLVMADRAAMGASLETRAPLMDHRIVEFIWSLPLSMKIRNDNKKWILRQVLYRYIPKEIVERPKMGFDVPVRDWLRGPLKEWAESLLDEKRIREEGFLNPAPIREKWIAHLEGKHDWSSNLWDVLMFQNWLEAQR
jgi:asparagine synthase (glutamine-hydrolysing)